jgi:hypothetical protein
LGPIPDIENGVEEDWGKLWVGGVELAQKGTAKKVNRDSDFNLGSF